MRDIRFNTSHVHEVNHLVCYIIFILIYFEIYFRSRLFGHVIIGTSLFKGAAPTPPTDGENLPTNLDPLALKSSPYPRLRWPNPVILLFLRPSLLLPRRIFRSRVRNMMVFSIVPDLGSHVHIESSAGSWILMPLDCFYCCWNWDFFISVCWFVIHLAWSVDVGGLFFFFW